MATLTRTLTFAQFYAAISNSLLNKGESVTISDFASVYYMVGKHEGSFAHLLEEGQPIIKTGVTEPLTVYATSKNTINIVAKSTTHPNDDIYYDWDSQNWLNNMNFSTDGENIIDGFKGVIYFRRDKLLNNQTNHDYRNVVNRLHSIAQAAWSEGLYNEGDFVQHTPTEGTLGIYVATGAITDEEPGVDAVWKKVIGIDETADRGNYLSFDDDVFTVGNYQIPIIDATDFEEREWIGESCFSCNIPQFILKEWGNNGEDILIPLIVFDNYCHSITYGDSCYCITYGNYCGGISYGNYCNSITYGNECNGITYGNYCDGITYGNDCKSITYGNNCGGISYGDSCKSITYKNDCYSITYGSGCSDITYGNGCNSITYGENAKNITFKESIQNVDAIAIELNLAGDENKDFTTNASGNVLMLYYDTLNVLQIVDLSV